MALKINRTVWSDLHHAFITDAQGRVKKVEGIAAVKTSIDNILNTRMGERVMLPQFASALKDIVFEPLNEKFYTMVADEVKRCIETWDDRVFVQGVQIETDPDKAFAKVYIEFACVGYQGTQNHTVEIRG